MQQNTHNTGLYTASKVSHAAKWKYLQAKGWPINSTWIDEAGEGESPCLQDLWIRCVREASQAQALLLYYEEGEILKGALVEVGAALASGVPVFVVGDTPVNYSFVNHPLVTKCSTIEEAMKIIGSIVYRQSPYPSYR